MSNPEALLLRWLKRSREASFAHYTAEARYSKFHYVIGIPAATLAAIVGTSVFASLDTAVDTRTKIVIGMISIIAAILTGVQTFLRYSERAERHRKTAVDYGSIRREIEQVLVYPNTVSTETVAAIRKRLDETAEIAPNVPRSIWVTSEKAAASSDYFVPASFQPVSSAIGASAAPGPATGALAFPTEGPRPRS
jgi:hypothetical protein